MPVDPTPRIANYRKSLFSPKVRPDPHSPNRAAASSVSNEPLDWTNGAVFTCEGRVICSPNSRRIVDLPPPVEENLSLKYDPVKDHPMKLHQPRWWSEETAYLAFVSILPKYMGLQAKHSLPPFSDPMEIHKYQVVKADRRGFGLELWRKLAWYALERKTLIMVDSMSFKYSLPPTRQVAENTLSVKNFYWNKHTFFADANRALKWFSVISSQMSWSIAMATTLDDEIATAVDDETSSSFIKRPSWLEYLSKCPVRYWDETMLQSVRKCMGAFGRQHPKVGVFINILNPPRYQYSVDWLIKFGVPVYYIWDGPALAQSVQNPALERFAPPMPFLQDLLTQQQDFARLHCIPLPDVSREKLFLSMRDPIISPLNKVTPHWETTYAEVSTPTPVINQPMAVDDFESYLAQWRQFTQKRKMETERAIKNESPKDAQRRQQRERNPPTVNTQVYVWDEGDDGCYVRVQVGKKDNEDTLAEFKPSHKIYNAVFNQWDCSHDFIVNEAVSDHGYESDEDDQLYRGYFDNPATDVAVPLPEPSATLASDRDSRGVASSDMLTLFREYYSYVPLLVDAADRAPIPEKAGMYVRNLVGVRVPPISLSYHQP